MGDDEFSAGVEIVAGDGAGGWGTDETAVGGNSIDWADVLKTSGNIFGAAANAAIAYNTTRTSLEQARLRADLTKAQIQGATDVTRATNGLTVRNLAAGRYPTQPGTLAPGALLSLTPSSGLQASPLLILVVIAFVVLSGQKK